MNLLSIHTPVARLPIISLTRKKEAKVVVSCVLNQAPETKNKMQQTDISTYHLLGLATWTCHLDLTGQTLSRLLPPRVHHEEVVWPSHPVLFFIV